MKKTLFLLLKKKTNVLILLLLSVVFFVLMKLVPVYSVLQNFYSLPNISFPRKLEVFYKYIFLMHYGSWKVRLMTVILSTLIALNIFLFVTYTKRTRSFIKLNYTNFLGSLWGMILGVFGVGCVSCGVLILAPLITFLGLGAYMNFFESNAYSISFIGLIFVLVSNFYLLYQLSKPITCSMND